MCGCKIIMRKTVKGGGRMELNSPITALGGVGAKRAALYAKLGIATVGDLLEHYPRRYLDLTGNMSIAEASTDTATASDRSRIEIVLRSLGVDSTRIYPVNSNTPVNNAA